ncbi:MAG: PKD domain-containing protein [Bacteroidia bacterium]
MSRKIYIKILPFLLSLSGLVLINKNTEACHALALVSYSAVTSATGVTVSGSSDSPTCGCGPYYMEIQLGCGGNFATSDGLYPDCNGAGWNTQFWWRSIITGNTGKPNCQVVAYNTIFIPYSALCPGTTYALRSRERLCGGGGQGPWSPVITFTTPGTPPALTGTLTASANPICSPNSTTLTANFSGGCGNITYSWSHGLGTGAVKTVNPTTTTTYTVTATTTCGQTATQSITITVNTPSTPATSITATPATICAGQSSTLTLNGGSLGLGATWQWYSGSCGGTPVGSGTSITVTPGTTTTYFVRAEGTCNTTTCASVTVTVNPGPTVTVSPTNPSICAGSSVSLSASGATSYTWTPATGLSSTTGANVTANPSTTTTYTVTGTTSGCSGTANVTVTVNPLPTVTITPANPTICSGQSVTLTANGADSYSWSPASGLSSTNTASVSASPTTTTTYTIIGTTTAGCTNTGTVTVSVTANPVVSVTPNNPAICSGQSVTLSASGATTYDWSPATGLSSTTGASVTASPATTTTYTVTGYNGTCSSTATTTVTVNPTPIVTVTPATSSICIGNNVTLTANGASTYSWSPATGLNQTTGATVTSQPSSAGTYTYTVTGTSAAGCISTATATVTVNPLPVISLGPNNPTICAGGNIGLTASGASAYTWAPSSGLSATTGTNVTATPSATTQYTVVGTDANGCVNTGNITVTVNPLPTLSVTPNSPSICVGSNTTLTASGASTYTWAPTTGLSSGSGSSVTASPANTTTYTITGTDVNGCTNTTSVTVTVNSLPNVTANAAPATICSGTTTTLTANGAVMYSWTPSGSLSSSSGSTVTGQPMSTTTYTVTGTDANGCVNTSTVTVTVNPSPTISTTASPSTICMGGVSILTASGGATYTWSPATGLSSTTGASVNASPSVTTTYTVTGTTVGGCSGTATVTVNVYPVISVTALGSGAICAGNSTSLTAIASGGNGGPYYYLWTPATGLNTTTSATVTASPTVTTTYTVTVTDNCGSPQGTAQVTVTVNPLPEVSFTADTLSGCAPVTVNFTNTSPTSFACAWDFGDNTYSNFCAPTHTFNEVGSYPISLTVTDANGCVNTQGGMTVNVYGYPTAEFNMGPQPTTIVRPLISFDGTVSSSDVVDWTWHIANMDTLTGNQVQYAFADTGSYPVTLYVVNEYGCLDSIVKEVVILGDYTLFIPNAFTPNEDGINDTWGPEGVGIGTQPGDYILYIFNRWGEMIFVSEDINKQWNGIPQGASDVAQQDSYMYRIIVKNSLGEKNQYIGHFNLVK